jgi:hypothetical protein
MIKYCSISYCANVFLFSVITCNVKYP